jgi:hypothetical protein
VASPPRLLSELRFGAFFSYCPRGDSEVAKNSRKVRDAIKEVQPDRLRQLFDRLQRDFGSTELHEVLGPDVTLVPTPRSSPLVKGALWPARRLAEELRARSFGRVVIPLVSRATAVPKSAFAGAGGRPTAERHIESLAIEPELINPGRVTVVDDVVTRGATLLAVASLIAAHFRDVEVSAFALLRTLSSESDFQAIVAPCVGTIRLTAAGKVWRDP